MRKIASNRKYKKATAPPALTHLPMPTPEQTLRHVQEGLEPGAEPWHDAGAYHDVTSVDPSLLKDPYEASTEKRLRVLEEEISELKAMIQAL